LKGKKFFSLIIKLKNIKEKGEKENFSLRAYFSVKPVCRQAGRRASTP